MRQFIRKHASWAKRGQNARSFLGEEADLRALAHSYLKRPLHPLICQPDGAILDGNRRHAGLELVGRLDADVDICVTDEALLDDQVVEIQLVSAIHRSDLSAWDKAVGMRDIKACRKGLTNKQLAEEVLNIDASLVTRYLSLFDTLPAVQEAAKAGRLGVSDWYGISKVAPDEQQAMLDLKLNGASRDALESHRRRQNGSAAVKASKVKCPLPSGCTITVTGQDVSLDDAIEALKEATKAMTKARDTGLDVKTAQSVWHDVAKAG